MTRGASVCPTKMFAAADRLSAPEVPRVFCMITAIHSVIRCMAPR